MRAGLDVVAALDPLNDSLEPEYGVRVAARIGIHTGPVVIGEMGGGAAAGMMALGDVPHVAERVRAAAAPDTVLITAATQHLVGRRFELEEREASGLDGADDPQPVHRVVRASGVAGRIAAATVSLTPFVGREAELATLVARWESARGDAGQAVLVAGDAGIGKSRLVLQLRETLAAIPHAWVESGATPYTTGTPFHPVIALVAQGLRLTPDDAAAQLACAAEAIAVAEPQGLPYLLGLGKVFHGAARVATGEASAIAELLAGMELAASAGDLGGAPASFVVLAEAHLAAGQPKDAVDAVEMGLALSAQTGQPFWDAELYRLRGELVLLSTEGRQKRGQAEKRAEECFRTALEIAIAQRTKQSELLAVTSLARLCQRRGRRAAGRRWLEPGVAWFTEGDATGDLAAARALLAELR